MGYRVLITGATGLVGRSCLRRFLSDPNFERVVVLTRRELPSELRRPDIDGKIEEHVVDFDRLEEAAPLMAVDQMVCALGTTIRRAGSKDRFREIDYGYPVTLARLGRNQGVRHYLLVSALGADSSSRFFYNRVKGDVEEAVQSLAFPATTILRPSVLLGKRDEFRVGEELAKRFGLLLPGNYHSIQADDVAAVTVDAARCSEAGLEIIESARIRRLARDLSGRGA